MSPTKENVSNRVLLVVDDEAVHVVVRIIITITGEVWGHLDRTERDDGPGIGVARVIRAYKGVDE